MLKFLPFKFLFIIAMLVIIPSKQILFAQDDDFLEADDWSDAMLEESSTDEPETSVSDGKKVVEPSNVSKEEKLPDSDKFEEEKSIQKKEQQKKEKVKKEKKNVPVEKTTTATLPPPTSPPPPLSEPEPEPEQKAPPRIVPPTDIKQKFVFEPIKPPEQNVTIGSAVKRAGPPLLLIARPVYAPYSDETKTMYISATAESYFHFKLGALPGISVLPIERMSNNIQYFRDFSRRISSSAYKEAAKKLGASYLLYSEYDPKGKRVKFATELYSIVDNKKIAGSVSEIDLAKFEDGLFDFVNEAAGAMIGTIPQITQDFLAASVFGDKWEQLGQQIAAIGDYSKKRADAVVSNFEKLAKGRSNHLARFAAVQVYAQAEQFDNAIPLMTELYESFGNKYSALLLILAQFYREQKSFESALETAQQVLGEPSLKLSAQIEIARIHEAQGDLKQAIREYEAVLSEGGEDGDIYFQLALVSIGLNDLNEARRYLAKVSDAGRVLDRGDYFDLGLRYETIGTATNEAINAYRNCIGLQQDNAEAWQKLADLYSLSGRNAEAAECYVSLFQIDNNLYKDYLIKAGKMYEEGGYLENAKDVYELYIGRRFDNPEVKVRLAKIEIYQGNCPKAIQLVDNMDTTGEFGEDIRAINTQCEKKVRIVVATGTQDKSWKAMFFWRVSSGAVLLGGIAGGYLMDKQVKERSDEYNNYTPESTVSYTDRFAEVAALRKKVEDAQKLRNLSYAVAGIGSLSLGLSFVLPIVLH